MVVHNAVLPVAGNLAALNTSANACTQAHFLEGLATQPPPEKLRAFIEACMLCFGTLPEDTVVKVHAFHLAI